MKMVNKLGAIAIAFAVVAVLALPAFAAGDVTVGQFVQRLAKEKNLNSATLEIAADSLTAVGVSLPAGLDFSARLTEGHVSRISRSMGLNVTTSRPERAFDDGQVDSFFSTFSLELGAGAGDDDSASTRGGETPDGASGGSNGEGPGFDPYAKGKGGSKGKKKGHRSATEPE